MQCWEVGSFKLQNLPVHCSKHIFVLLIKTQRSDNSCNDSTWWIEFEMFWHVPTIGAAIRHMTKLFNNRDSIRDFPHFTFPQLPHCFSGETAEACIYRFLFESWGTLRKLEKNFQLPQFPKLLHGVVNCHKDSNKCIFSDKYLQL